MTLELLHFLLSLPIILTVVLGVGLGAAALSDWTQAQKTLLVGSFYLITTLFCSLIFWSYLHPDSNIIIIIIIIII
jgi:hypothetical protein